MTKLLVVGYGSIGRRHARLAAELAETAVFDINAVEAPGLQIFRSLDAALAWKPTGVIVATPPESHVEVARKAIESGAHVLIEKPVSSRIDDVPELLERAKRLGRKLNVVCNMRFHPGVAAIHANIERIGAIRFLRAQYGNYLPDMRPGADYRELYCARAAKGGGAILDAIHEIDYAAWLLGPITAVTGEAERLSDLDLDVEDYAGILFRHASGARSEIHLDYLQRYKQRGCEVVGERGTIKWHSDGKAPERCTVVMHLVDAQGRAERSVLYDGEVDVDVAYRRLLQTFVTGFDSAQASLLDGYGALAVLKAAFAARQSAASGHRIAM